jgi:hypothetical protein
MRSHDDDEKLRPGLGSCTPNWGTHDDRNLRDFFWGFDPDTSRCGNTSDPVSLGLAPRPATGEPPKHAPA